jgi:hypothetical protein
MTTRSSSITSTNPHAARCRSASVPSRSAKSARFSSIEPVRFAGSNISDASRRRSGAASGERSSIRRITSSGNLCRIPVATWSDTILGRLLAENEAGSLTEEELFYFAMLLLLAGNRRPPISLAACSILSPETQTPTTGSVRITT